MLALSFLMVAALGAQSLTVQPDIATAEAAYRDAQNLWLHHDTRLEAELFKVSPTEAHRRIDAAAALRDDVMVKKQVYLTLIIDRTRQMRGRLDGASNGTIPADAVKKDLEQEQRRILTQQDDLEQLLRELPEGDEYLLVRRALQDDRNNLIKQQNAIAQRIRSMDFINKAQQATKSVADGNSLEANLDAVLEMWTKERESAVQEREAYAKMYATMKAAVGQATGSQAAAAVHNPTKNLTKGKSAPPAAASTAKTAGAPLTGVWVYRSQKGAWTGYAEPADVRLELHLEGDVLRGSYSASLPTKSQVQSVQLILEGKAQSATSATLHWKSNTPPAVGEMTLKLGADGRLLLERSQSGDSFIPLGSEVLSHR